MYPHNIYSSNNCKDFVTIMVLLNSPVLVSQSPVLSLLVVGPKTILIYSAKISAYSDKLLSSKQVYSNKMYIYYKMYENYFHTLRSFNKICLCMKIMVHTLWLAWKIMLHTLRNSFKLAILFANKFVYTTSRTLLLYYPQPQHLLIKYKVIY